MFGEGDLVKNFKQRAAIISNVILISFAIILARLWYLQIYRGKILYRYSLENRLRQEVVQAPRGLIYSRNNKILAYNVPRFDAVITPQHLKNHSKTLEKLSKILSMKESRVRQILKKNLRQAKYRPVVIKKNISRKEVALLETEYWSMPGVSVFPFISREYLDKEIGAHLFGYISEISQKQLPKYRKRDNFDYKLGDFIGQAGIELRFDRQLRGVDGHEFMEVDAQGRKKRHVSTDNLFAGIEDKPALPGRNLRLTIDRDLQLTAYEALEGKVGSAVVVDVHTGEVLAMVSRPSFDPVQFAKGLSNEYWNTIRNNSNNPMRDRTIQEHYPPGSTFKLITAIAALEEGIVDENTEFHCPGFFKLGRRRVHCWKRYGHGKVDIVKSIRESCDVYYYKIATKLDIDVLAKYARMLGFGNKSGITLSREISGLIPTKEWKKKRDGIEWQMGETLSCVIGQSYVLATPLQLSMAFSAIANGGKLYRPRLVREIFNNSGEIDRTYESELVRNVDLKPKTLELIRRGLIEVVNKRKGTAWWYRGRGIQMAGKTGTSQVMRFSADKIFGKCEEREFKQRHHGLFVAYAPYSSPDIAISVVVEHGCSGSSAGAPVARAIATAYMKKYRPEFHEKLSEKERKAYLKLLREEKQKKEEAEAKKKSSEQSSEQESQENE